jgi:hypothetical protein
MPRTVLHAAVAKVIAASAATISVLRIVCVSFAYGCAKSPPERQGNSSNHS